MLTKTVFTLAIVFAAMGAGALEINRATEAELDGVKGIGPSTTARILRERSKGEFLNWSDLMARVKGIKAASAARLSQAGLTVGGAPFSAAKDQ